MLRSTKDLDGSQVEPRWIERACDSAGTARTYSLRVNAFPEWTTIAGSPG